MVKKWFLYSTIVLQILFSSIALAAGGSVPIICYHDVGEGAKNEYTVSKETLRSHLSYLKTNGYNPISLQQYIAFTKDGAPLPDKPVMLTFDDGYVSFYKEVFPLLKEYNYPAMLAIVGSWMEYSPPDIGKLVSWQQLREMESSGLVSIASHSFQSHHFTAMNAQGDRGQSLSTRIYSNGRYEDAEDFKQRVTDDLKMSQQQFEKELGHKVAALVWPYGEYNLLDIDIARNEGFEAMFTLGDAMNVTGQKGLVEARRWIIMGNPSAAVFAAFVKERTQENKAMKGNFLEIDTLYDPSSLRATDNNLKLAIARFKKRGTNTVFLQAFSSESKGDKVPEVYFYTTAAPVKADIFSHLANGIRKEGLRVYAVMPSLVSQLKDGSDYKGVTSFSPVVQKKLIDLYSDLGSYAYADGVLFQNDPYRTNKEELLPETEDVLRGVTLQLIKAVRTYRPYAFFAKDISAEQIVNKNTQEQYYQNYRSCLDTYDYTVITANVFSEKQSVSLLDWLGNLAQIALREPNAAKKVAFKLQTFDLDKKVWVKERDLKDEVDALRNKGAIHFMYYPENIVEDETAK